VSLAIATLSNNNGPLAFDAVNVASSSNRGAPPAPTDVTVAAREPAAAIARITATATTAMTERATDLLDGMYTMLQLQRSNRGQGFGAAAPVSRHAGWSSELSATAYA
jgi:hypothetical protein